MGLRPVVPCLQPRGLSLESPPQGVSFVAMLFSLVAGVAVLFSLVAGVAVLFSLVAGVAVALSRHWCEVP